MNKIPEYLEVEKVIPVKLTPVGNGAHGIVHARFAGALNAFIVICTEKQPDIQVKQNGDTHGTE